MSTFFWGSIPPDPKSEPHSQPCYAVCDSAHWPQAYRMLYPTLGNTYNMDTLFYIGSSKILTKPEEQALFVRKRQARGKREASEGPSPVVLVSSPSLSSSFCSPEKHERTIIMPVLQANYDCTRQQKLLEVLWGRILSTDGEVGTSITNSASQCKGWEDNSIFKRNQLLRLSINRQNLPIKKSMMWWVNEPQKCDFRMFHFNEK